MYRKGPIVEEVSFLLEGKGKSLPENTIDIDSRLLKAKDYVAVG